MPRDLGRLLDFHMKMETSLLDFQTRKDMGVCHHHMEMEASLLCNSIPSHRHMEMEVSLLCNSILASLIRATHPSTVEGRSNVEADIHQGEVVVAGIASSQWWYFYPGVILTRVE
jgi:hypothetical protein